MSLLNRRALTGLMAAVSLAGMAGAAAAAPDLSDQKMLGNPKAPIQVVEYASASCPHCARFDLNVFPAFKKKYIDTGRVHFTFREMLTPPEQVAAAGFLLARCAGPGKYFTTLDAVFRSQQQWAETGDARAALVGVAKEAGLTEAQFDACMTDQAALKAINDRVEKYATLDKVDSTPTFFINGVRLQAGVNEIDLAALDAAIKTAPKRAAKK